MKKQLIVFPGSFCPPTYGHLEIVKTAAETFSCGLTIMSSENPEKDNWFSQEERAQMWQAYDLPGNVRVTTLEQMMREKVDFSNMVMVRGIRNEDDYLHEQAVMGLNFNKFGINKYFYLMTDGRFRELSSSRARKAAQQADLKVLAESVAPEISGKLLEYALKAKNLFLVVGRPGSGKSTWLKYVCEIDPNTYHINSDEINQELRPYLETAFPGKDLYRLATENEEMVLEVLAPKWLELLGEKLLQTPPGKNIYVEAAYGLESNKRLYRYLGSKVVYVGCQDPEINRQRIATRGTSQHLAFVEKIPDLEQSVLIAASNKLALTPIDSSGNLSDLKMSAENFVANLNSRN